MIYGTSLTLSVRSVVLGNTFPFFTAVFAHLFVAGDRLTWRTSAGSLLGLAGVALAAVAAAPASDDATVLSDALILGDAVVLASAAGLGQRLAVSKRLLSTVPPERLLVWMMALSIPLSGSLALGPAAIISLLYERLGAVAVRHCLAACSPLPSRKLANGDDSLMPRGAGPQRACP